MGKVLGGAAYAFAAWLAELKRKARTISFQLDQRLSSKQAMSHEPDGDFGTQANQET